MAFNAHPTVNRKRLHTANSDCLPVFSVQEAAFFDRFPFLVSRFIFEPRCSGRLGPYLPPAIRGALGEALLDNCDQSSCGICEEIPYCAFQCLLADESKDQGPPPLIIEAPKLPSPWVEAETVFTFTTYLFGQAMEAYPALLRALQVASAGGLNKGRMPCRLVCVEEIFAGTLDSRTQPENPSQLRVQFITPLRLKAQGRIVGERELDFRIFWSRLKGRLKLMAEAHCGIPPGAYPLPFFTGDVEVVEDRLRWIELQHYSFRQAQRNSLSGLVGSITFAGELAPYLPYLRLGEITHVGSGCVYGLGKYRLIIESDSHAGPDS